VTSLSSPSSLAEAYATMAPTPLDPAEAVESAKVVVFSKTSCPFCKQVKELLAEKGLDDVRYIELDEMAETECERLQNNLEEMTGQRTVPNVFINGMHLGKMLFWLKKYEENINLLGLI